jgi:drug/metabolite transporter (DMT)-like permease
MSSKILTKPWPYLALLLAHLIWGANFVVAKITLQEFPTYTLAFLRFAFASLLLAPFLFAETKKLKIKIKDLPSLILIGILIITLNISLFFAGIEKTSVIDASVLTLVIPVLSVILGWVFLKEKVFIINLVGIALSLIGAILILGLPQILLGTYSPKSLLGNFLILLASITWVVGAFVSRKMLKIYPSLIVTGVAFLVGVITFAVPATIEYIQNPLWPTKVTTLGILGLTYMTLLSSISAYFLFEWGLAKTSLISADLFQYIEPFIAAGLAVLILQEHISLPFVIGSVLIILGVYWGTLAKERHHHAHRTHRH